MRIRPLGGDAAACSAGNESLLQEVGFVNVANGVGLLADCCRQGVDSDRATVELRSTSVWPKCSPMWLLFLTENYRQRLTNQTFEPVAFIKPIDTIDRPLGLGRLVAEID
jgi:hypothetical protein